MLDTQMIPDKKETNGKAIGSLLIGIASIIGIFLVGNGAILSVAGLLLGILSLIETKTQRENGEKLAVIGIMLNFLGILSFFF